MDAAAVADKVIVITGASRGLGAGLAESFAAAGARLGLCARSPLTPRPGAVCAALDVADDAAVARFADAVATQLGPIHLWINNAGLLAPIGPLVETERAAVVRHLETNVLGVWAGARAFARHRRAVGAGGVLINVSSGAGRVAYAGWSMYCAGKAAVDRMSECLALEEKAHGLRVHAVAPGIIDTDMQAMIRATSAEHFPMVDKFVKLKAEGRFSTTAWVAARLAALAFDPAHRTDDVLVQLPAEKPF